MTGLRATDSCFAAPARLWQARFKRWVRGSQMLTCASLTSTLCKRWVSGSQMWMCASITEVFPWRAVPDYLTHSSWELHFYAHSSELKTSTLLKPILRRWAEVPPSKSIHYPNQHRVLHSVSGLPYKLKGKVSKGFKKLPFFGMGASTNGVPGTPTCLHCLRIGDFFFPILKFSFPLRVLKVHVFEA